MIAWLTRRKRKQMWGLPNAKMAAHENQARTHELSAQNSNRKQEAILQGSISDLWACGSKECLLDSSYPHSSALLSLACSLKNKSTSEVQVPELCTLVQYLSKCT